MPRLRVIFLAGTPDDPNTWQAALWADVPAARQTFYADPSPLPPNQAAKTSAWLGATAADNTNLQNGSVTERVITQRVPPGTNISQVENYLQAVWSNFQDSVNNNNPWVHYGSTWDGTTWNVVTVT
jgi:hypothetical protein